MCQYSPLGKQPKVLLGLTSPSKGLHHSVLVSDFFKNQNLKEEKTPAKTTSLASWEGLRELLISLVVEFSMLNKFCCFIIVTLSMTYSLSNALDLFFYNYQSVGRLFWVFSNFEGIE